MYGEISDFLKDLSAESPILWALLVLGTIATLSLALYVFWELLLRLVFHGPSRERGDGLFTLIRVRRSRGRQSDSGQDRS